LPSPLPQAYFCIMALIIVFGMAYASYQTYHAESSSETDPEINLEGKVSVQLLPLELTSNLLEAPISTITFFEGHPAKAVEYLQTRVADIAYRNPWIGGWLLRDSKSKELRLWYDPSGDNLAPGLLQVFEPGQIPLHRDALYENFHEMLMLHGATVPPNKSLVGKNHPILKISVIPDDLSPTERFSVVMSMSHIGGDKHTYYQLFNMLYRGAKIFALNPVRKLAVSDAVYSRMGQKESFYVRNATKEPMWQPFQGKEVSDPMQVKMFYFSCQWVDERKKQASKAQDENEGFEVDMRQSNYAVLASWFFGIANSTVGLLTFNFRNFLQGFDLNDMDAGNYQNPIPLTAIDYATPGLIQRAMDTGKRCGTDPIAPLPKNYQTENSCSIAIDWAESRDAAIDMGEDVEETLHVPMYSAKALRGVPNRLSFMVLFTACAKTAHRVKRDALLVVAAKSVFDKLDDCGIVEEVIYVAGG
jgi:hypothetical protein